MSESNVRCAFVGLTGALCGSVPKFHVGFNHPFTRPDEIGRLAAFIMDEVPGEPSLSEGAVDTAIRLIQRLRELEDEILSVRELLKTCSCGLSDLLRVAADRITTERHAKPTTEITAKVPDDRCAATWMSHLGLVTCNGRRDTHIEGHPFTEGAAQADC